MIISQFYHIWSATIYGVVKDFGGNTLPMAVILAEGRQYKTVCNLEGEFELNLPQGEYSLSAQMIGFVSQTKMVTVGEDNLEVNFILEEKVTELKEAKIEVQTKTEQLKEQPYAVEVVETEPLKTQNLDVNEVLNSVSGVRIREEGGLGSTFNFSLNGFTGRQVRFFVDGIPMDNFGSSLSLNNIPVNLISRIEIYKGVVPIHLGADALGGAVNIVTDQSVKNFVDASYSIGSFNTHRAALVTRYHFPKSGVFVNANGFFNYSDNNYKIEVGIVDKETGKYGDPEEVERFHDAYQSQTAQVDIGVRNKKYADLLLTGAILSGNYKEVQTGYNMTEVAGEVFKEDVVFIPYLKYRKDDFLTKKLDLKFYANYNKRKASAVDTSSKIYDWYGDYTTRDILNTAGEITWYKTYFFFDDQSALGTLNLSYELGKNHSISLNNNFSTYSRVGVDTVTYGEVPFKEPNILTKNITGLSYNLDAFDSKLKTVVFGKLFLMDAKVHESSTIGIGQDLEDINVSFKNSGYGIASTYYLQKQTQLKMSYENTYRLPDAMEMFGDGLLLLSNVHLGPERSDNFNFGFLHRAKLKHHEFLIEGEYLFRLSDDLIRQVSVGVTSYFENLVAAKSHIVEGGVKYRYKKVFDLQINGTYQQITNNQEYTSTGGENYLYGDRLPNRPYLFGNVAVGLHKEDFLKKGNDLAFNWSAMFVEAFYLKWPSQGNSQSKHDIPRQVSHRASISYSLKEGKYNVSFTCNNLFDKALFDNFMLQKPGRAFSVKLRYYFQSKRIEAN